MKVKSIVEDGLNTFAIVEHGKERRRYRLCRRTGAISAYATDGSGKPSWEMLPSAAARKVRRAIDSQRAEIRIEGLPPAPKKARGFRPSAPRASVGPAMTPDWMSAIPEQLRDLAAPEAAIPLPIRFNLMQLLRTETF